MVLLLAELKLFDLGIGVSGSGRGRDVRRDPLVYKVNRRSREPPMLEVGNVFRVHHAREHAGDRRYKIIRIPSENQLGRNEIDAELVCQVEPKHLDSRSRRDHPVELVDQRGEDRISISVSIKARRFPCKTCCAC